MSILKPTRNFKNLELQKTGESNDETDKPPNSYHVTLFDLGSLLYSIIFHFIDVFYDFYMAYAYFTTEKYYYFVWMIAFIAFSSVVITLISIRMYVEDGNISCRAKRSKIRIALCVLGIVVQLAPVIRNFDSLYYAIKSLKAESKSDRLQQKKFFNKMLCEDSDVALLRVFECYLESAPQQALRITFLLVDYSHGYDVHTTKQIISITLGFLAMGWCMTNYNRCIRFDQEDKQNMSAVGAMVQFFWHLNFTVSRILMISALATLYLLWTCVAVVIHWCIMLVWLAISTKTTFCGKSKIFEVFFLSAIGLIYIFNFISLVEGSTKKSYVIYYVLCLVENVVAASIWGVKSTTVFKNWIYYIFVVCPILCFVVSAVFLILYYKSFHPNKLKSGVKNDEKNGMNTNMHSYVHEQRITLTDEHNN